MSVGFYYVIRGKGNYNFIRIFGLPRKTDHKTNGKKRQECLANHLVNCSQFLFPFSRSFQLQAKIRESEENILGKVLQIEDRVPRGLFFAESAIFPDKFN